MGKFRKWINRWWFGEVGEVTIATEVSKTLVTQRQPSERPWKRGTFGEDMEPLTGARQWNSTGTFCRYCGDWITDSAYYTEHSGHHRPLRGSWNYEHPNSKRRDPDDIKPNHAEWLEDVKDYCRQIIKSGTISMGGTGWSIGPGEREFHSEEEMRDTLEPFGFTTEWSKDSGISMDGGRSWSGGWNMSFSRSRYEKYLSAGEQAESVLAHAKDSA